MTPNHLQLHADVLLVLADAVQGSDGRLHMATVLSIDQQPRRERETEREREKETERERQNDIF